MSASKRLEPSCLAAGVVHLALGLALVACVRPPLPGVCPQVAAGDLVVSELRGPQDRDANGFSTSYREWVELYNAGDAAIALTGVKISFTRLDGTGTVGFVVRDEALEVAPGAYVVLGGGDPGEEDYIDYDYTPDYHVTKDPADPNPTLDPRSIYSAAILDVSACGVLVDRVTYALPSFGTLALDGATAPDAAANDDSNAGWCVDVRLGEGPQTETGVRGSPGEANPPCP